jgi:hypothetical protein
MVDTQRIQNAPQCISGLARIAAQLAAQSADHCVNVLQVATYVPLDVETVGRMLESLREREDVSVCDKEGFEHIHFDDPESFFSGPSALTSQDHLLNNVSLLKHLARLREDATWVRQVQLQHALLKAVSKTRKTRLSPDFFQDALEFPAPLIKSTLGDLCANAHSHMELDAHDRMVYTFPPLTYPKDRYDQNMELLSNLPKPYSSNLMVWGVLALVVALAVFGLVWRM